MNKNIKLIVIILVVVLVIAAIGFGVWFYMKSESERVTEEFSGAEQQEKCGFEQGEKPSIDINKGFLRAIYVKTNGVKYTWDGAPIDSIRLTNFDFDRHSVHVVVNETEPQCKRLKADNDGEYFTVKKAYFNQDVRYFLKDDKVYIKNKSGEHELKFTGMDVVDEDYGEDYGEEEVYFDEEDSYE